METAVVTGASEGIGYQLSKLFALNKINLVLVARNEKRLKEISEELSVLGISVRYYSKDLSILENAEFVYEDLKREKTQIVYLVNNAGYGICGEYCEIPWESEYNMFNLNMISLAFLTKKIAGDMVIMGKGRILNISSFAAFQPGPYMAAYCASKSFVLSYSEAISYELKKKGVSVTCLCPGVTNTKFHDVAGSRNTNMLKAMLNASAEDVAKYGYRIMMKGKSYGIYGFSNRLLIILEKFICRSLVIAITAKVLRLKKQ